MGESFAAAIVLFVLFGYVGLSVAVGMYASNRGWSFFLFFLVALFFNPIIGFVGVIVLDALMGAADADTLSEGARNLAQRGKQAVHQQGMDDVHAESGGPESSTAPSAPGPGGESNEPSSPESEADTPEAQAGGGSLDATYEAETQGTDEEGKVRCDTCYSLIDESATECPACGTDL